MNTTMNSDLNPPSRAALWTGRILGAIVVLALLADAGVSLFASHLLAKNMEETGFPVALSAVVGGILAVSTVLYAIPRTSVLGAILLTGFLGGAICTHLRMGEMGSPPQIASALLGIAAWASLYLRSNAVRALLPLTGPRS
jgi:DoxX-like family